MKERIESIDGLKIFFCISVVLYHYYIFCGQSDLHNVPHISSFLYKYGSLGVEFFFMVSGFFIAYKYKKPLQDNSLKTTDFLKKRLFSLYPSYLVSIILGIVVCGIDGILTQYSITGRPVNVYDIWCAVTMTSKGWVRTDVYPYGGMTWFINILFLCYVLFAGCVKLSKSALSYIVICILFVALGWQCISSDFNICFLHVQNGHGYLSFFLGCLLYELQVRYRENLTKLCELGILLTILALALSKMFGYEQVLGNVFFACTLFFIPLTILSAINVKPLKKILSSKLLLQAGSLTMGIYFTHQHILKFVLILNKYYGLNINFESYKTFLSLMLIILAVGVLWHLIIDNMLLPKIKNSLYRRTANDRD